MATKKKTSKKTDWLDDQVDELNNAFADKVFEDKKPARKAKKSSTDPIIVKGSHLTVTTWADGRTELKWDDDALLRDVQAATLKFESNIPAAKITAKKKPVAKKTVTKKTKK